MWTQIAIDDQAGLQNFVGIMRQMDPRYGALLISDVLELLRETPSEAWHYGGSGFEIVMLFKYSGQRSQWQVMYLGFVGNAQPSDVLAQVIVRVGAFANSHGTQYLFAFRPATIGYAPLEQLYELVLLSPLMQITVLRETDQGVFWKIEYIDPPLGNMTSAGHWLHVTTDDLGLVKRFLGVMNQMDNRYRRESAQLFGMWPAHLDETWGGAYYYWRSDCQVVARFEYDGRRRQFQVSSVGLLGAISEAAALDLVVEKAVSFLRSHSGASMFARRPKRMKSAQIMKLHDLVPHHSRMRVTVEKDTPTAVRWNIVFPELELADTENAASFQSVS